MTSVFPSPWKSSFITPVAKVRSPSTPSDFRPISLLCQLSKILERIVLDDLIKYLRNSALIDQHQYGFVTGGSTQAALVRVLDAVRHATDRREVTILVLFDFSKAFDTVGHAKLIDKLAAFNLSCSVLHSGFGPILQVVVRQFAQPRAYLTISRLHLVYRKGRC